MTRARISIIAILIGCLVLSATGGALAQDVGFSLATWQSVTVGTYTLQYTGLRAGWPSYELYAQGAFLAAFPPDPLPPTCCEYNYGNVSIITTGVAPDGSAATGTMTLR